MPIGPAYENEAKKISGGWPAQRNRGMDENIPGDNWREEIKYVYLK
jgi:hypothetical protein